VVALPRDYGGDAGDRATAAASRQAQHRCGAAWGAAAARRALTQRAGFARGSSGPMSWA